MKCSTCHPSVSSCCTSHNPVKVGHKNRVLVLQHVQKMIPLVFSPRLKPLCPQVELALKDAGELVFHLSAHRKHDTASSDAPGPVIGAEWWGYLERTEGIQESAHFPRHGFPQQVVQEALLLSRGPVLEPAQDAPLLLQDHVGDGFRFSGSACARRRAGQVLQAERGGCTVMRS